MILASCLVALAGICAPACKQDPRAAEAVEACRAFGDADKAAFEMDACRLACAPNPVDAWFEHRIGEGHDLGAACLCDISVKGPTR